MRLLIGVIILELRFSVLVMMRCYGELLHFEMALGMIYLCALELVGAMLVVLLLVGDVGVYFDCLDVVCLFGGFDLDLNAYGVDHCYVELGLIELSFDVFELVLLNGVLECGMLIFVICCGVQVLNVVCGGMLY